jgi:hypothetical protein
MTKEELAKQLNGIEYKDIWRVSREFYSEAKESGLVVVHGASDDLMEFRGAIYDECGVGERDSIYLTKDGFFDKTACDCECKYFQKAKSDFKSTARCIDVFWCPKDENGAVIASWVYSSTIPHEVFDVMEDDEIYCKGIVFNLSDV